MEVLGPEADSLCSDDYIALGLKDSKKGNLGNPQSLSLLATLLEKSVQKNERLLETSQTKDVITIFHGFRAPSLSIQQYIDRIFRFFDNAYYARVGGVSTAEMNKLEMKFLFCLDFRLYVSVQTFGKYCSLFKRVASGGLIDRSIQACGVEETL